MKGMIRSLAMVLAALGTACSRPPALTEAQNNETRIPGVAMNQSMAQVITVMGRPPDSVAERRLGNSVQETVWYYLTDYASGTRSAITFHDGQVLGITQEPGTQGGDRKSVV